MKFIYNNKKNALLAIFFIYVIAAVCAIGLYELAYGWVEKFDFHPHLLAFLIVDVVATAIVYFAGVLFKNASVYDPYWSVAPIVAVFGWAIALERFDLPVILVLIAVSLWGIRLTTNWAIGFKGMKHPDWRYVDIEAKHPKSWPLINFLGIHLMPTLVVYLALVPVGLLITNTAASTDSFLIVFGFLISTTAVWIQSSADKAMRRFRKTQTKPTAPKTIRDGMWNYSRHPNYFGEILFWFGIWILQMGANGNWASVIGAVLVALLFLFVSIPMMERHLIEKNAEYKTYRQTVSMLIPWFRKK